MAAMLTCVIQYHEVDILTVNWDYISRHPLMNLHTQLTDGHLYLMKRHVVDLLTEERQV